GDVYESYLPLHAALADDALTKAQDAAAVTTASLAKVDMTLLDADAHMVWMQYLDAIKEGLTTIAQAKDIDSARIAFESVAMHLEEAVAKLGIQSDRPVFIAHCPMAFGD